MPKQANNTSFLTKILLNIIFLSYSVTSFSLSGYELRDLESNTSYFETEASTWQISNRLTSSNASLCGSTWLLGGYGIVGDLGTLTRTYTSLPPHTMISFSLDVWLIDMVELADLFQIFFDGTLVETWNSKLGLLSWSFFTQICGGASIDYSAIKIQGQIAHTSSQLTVKIASLFKSKNNFFSIGFRNFNILFRTSGSTSPSICDFSLQVLSLSTLPSCLCPAGQYDSQGFGIGGCKSCSSTCKTCTGASVKDCTSCYPGYYFDQSKCSQCDPTCIQCNGTGPTSCTQCAPGQFLYPNGTCQAGCAVPYQTRTAGEYQYCEFICNSSQFLYQNMSCLSTCPAPFVQSSQGNVNYCNFPCSNSAYLYSNGSCLSTCNSPYTAINNTIANYCQSPCSTSQYLYPNNTCLATCQAPYTVMTVGDLSYCTFPCASPDFLYWNGSCLLTCPVSSQSISGLEKSCSYYCSDYTYWNSSCLSTCNSPLVQTTNAAMNQLCSLPCSSSQYLLPNGSCSASCAYNTSTTPDGVVLCNYPCTSGTYLYENQTCLPTCPTPYIAQVVDANLTNCLSPCLSSQCYMSSQSKCVNQCNYTLTMWQSGLLTYCENINIITTTSNTSTNTTTTGSLGTLVNAATQALSVVTAAVRSNNPNSAFMIATVKLLKYTSYIQAPIHTDVQAGLSSSSSSVYSIPTLFVIEMPQSLQDQVPNQSLPAVFENHLSHSSYLVNHWETMSTYVIFFILGLGCALLEKMFSIFEKKLLKLIFMRLRTITQWNFALFIIFNTYDDLTLYAILEFRSLSFDSFASVLSFGVCLFVSYIALYLLAKVFVISREAVKIKKQILSHTSQTNPTIAFYKKWESYQVLFAGYDNNSFITQAFLFFYTLRIIITYMIVGLLFEYPVVQTVLFLVLSIMVLTYLGKKRPIKDFFTMQVCGLFEVLVFIVNVCLFLLTVLNATGHLTSDLQFKISQVILFAVIITDFTSNMSMWVFIYYAARSAYRAGKAHGLSGKTSWLIVLTSPYQNYGQGFHELSNYDTSNPGHLLEYNQNPNTFSGMRRRKQSVNAIIPFTAIGFGVKENISKSHRNSISDPETNHETVHPKSIGGETPKLALNCSHDSKNAIDLEAPFSHPHLSSNQGLLSSYHALSSSDAQSALLRKNRSSSPRSALTVRKRKSSFSQAVDHSSDESKRIPENLGPENTNLERRRSSFSSLYQEVLSPKPRLDVSSCITENLEESSPVRDLLKFDFEPTGIKFAKLKSHIDSPSNGSLKKRELSKRRLVIRKAEHDESDSTPHQKLLVTDLEDTPKSIVARNHASEVVMSKVDTPTNKVRRKSLMPKKEAEEKNKTARKSVIHDLFFGGEESNFQKR